MLKTNGINFLLVIFLVCNCQRGNAESPVIAYTEFGEIKLQEFIDDYQEFLTFTGVEDNLLFRNGMLKSEIDRLFLLKYANDSEFTKKEYVAKKIENSIGQT
ncbi:MAG: hypothetical protein ACE5D7_10490, partial [Fidelibacterota bacterium]